MYIYIHDMCLHMYYIYIWLYECIPIWNSYRKWIHLKVPLFVVNPNAPFRDGDWHEKKKPGSNPRDDQQRFLKTNQIAISGGYQGLSWTFMVYPRFIHGLSMVYHGLTKIVNPKFLAFSVYPPLWVNQWEAKSQGAGFQSQKNVITKSGLGSPSFILFTPKLQGIEKWEGHKTWW